MERAYCETLSTVILSYLKDHGGIVKKVKVLQQDGTPHGVCVKGFLMGKDDINLKFEISISELNKAISIKNTGCVYFNEIRHGAPLYEGFCNLNVDEPYAMSYDEKDTEHLLSHLAAWFSSTTDWLLEKAPVIALS